jgi:arsenite-transporting ATPase
VSALDQLLDSLPTWVFVGGKGGVGKTTCAAALASRSAARGARTLLLSTDPARSLGTAIGTSLTGEPQPVTAASVLHAMQLDPVQARTAFLARWRNTLIQILDRGTYLDPDDIAGLVDAALPGADEAMALLALLDLEDRSEWARIVVDTAPTGHTLRLLELPDTFEQLLALLDAMQEKHRFMVRALTHRYRADDADRFLAEMTRRLRALRDTLRSAERTAFVLVTRPEPMVSAETARYAAALERLGIAIRALIINAVPGEAAAETARALAALDAIARGVPRFLVPLLDAPPLGFSAIERWAAALRTSDLPAAPPSPAKGRTGARVHGAANSARPRTAALTIVAGKGGVGKTSVACALAVDAASASRRVLLVSTDPAPSIADALDTPIGDEVTAVPGAEGLCAQQLDAAAAFARFRDAYGRRVDALFDAVLGRGVDAAVDRRIARDLLSLAPPGVDELYALAALGETLEQTTYASLIVDPAPTGHLLRLLDMPALALDWSHRLLRLMLKYKEVAELGSAAEEILAFARRTRALQQLLHTPERSAMVIVTLDEPLVRAETARLMSEIGERGIAIAALVWNRATRPPRPLPGYPATDQFQAAEVDPPPRGTGALREWLAGWTPLEAHGHD